MYLPSVMLCALEDLHKLDLCINWILSDLTDHFEPNRDRWRLLSKTQRSVVEQWLEWLSSVLDANDAARADKARFNLQKLDIDIQPEVKD
jgi:hypothetical protein